MRHENDFAEILKNNQEFKRFERTGKDSQGFLSFSCTWCTKDGRCCDYDNRLQLCENFPDRDLPFCGGTLPEGCGFRFEAVRSFRLVYKREVNRLSERKTLRRVGRNKLQR